jgi:hypothetical protein
MSAAMEEQRICRIQRIGRASSDPLNSDDPLFSTMRQPITGANNDNPIWQTFTRRISGKRGDD